MKAWCVRAVDLGSEPAMEESLVAANLGALFTAALGALGLLAPNRAAAFTSIAPIGLNGFSEIRATYGGLFVALGLWCLLGQSETVFCTAAIAWLGAAAGRLASIGLDRNLEARNLGGVCLEATVGLLLLSPTWTRFLCGG